jgi:hypothetical protein
VCSRTIDQTSYSAGASGWPACRYRQSSKKISAPSQWEILPLPFCRISACSECMGPSARPSSNSISFEEDGLAVESVVERYKRLRPSPLEAPARCAGGPGGVLRSGIWRGAGSRAAERPLVDGAPSTRRAHLIPLWCIARCEAFQAKGRGFSDRVPETRSTGSGLPARHRLSSIHEHHGLAAI